MQRISILLLLLSFSSGILAGNPVKWVWTKADSLLAKIYYKVDYDTAYICRSPGKIGLKAWGNLSGNRLQSHGYDHGVLKNRLEGNREP